MIFYKLTEGSYSYDIHDTSGFANLYTKDDIIFWARDVNMIISEEAEEPTDKEANDVVGISHALDVLESANEYFEEIRL